MSLNCPATTTPTYIDSPQKTLNYDGSEKYYKLPLERSKSLDSLLITSTSMKWLVQLQVVNRSSARTSATTATYARWTSTSLDPRRASKNMVQAVATTTYLGAQAGTKQPAVTCLSRNCPPKTMQPYIDDPREFAMTLKYA